jgi:hypothetical protein
MLEGRGEGKTQCSSFHVLVYFLKINNFRDNVLQDARDIYDTWDLNIGSSLKQKVWYKSTKVNVPK